MFFITVVLRKRVDLLRVQVSSGAGKALGRFSGLLVDGNTSDGSLDLSSFLFIGICVESSNTGWSRKTVDGVVSKSYYHLILPSISVLLIFLL